MTDYTAAIRECQRAFMASEIGDMDYREYDAMIENLAVAMEITREKAYSIVENGPIV